MTNFSPIDAAANGSRATHPSLDVFMGHVKNWRPTAPRTEAPALAGERTLSLRATVSGRPQPRILLVDDESSSRASLAANLRKWGCVVEEAGTPEDAVHALERTSFDLVIIEPSLPRTNWYSMLKSAQNAAPSACFLVLTSYPSTALAVETKRLGGIATLSKPINLADLNRVVATPQPRPELDQEGPPSTLARLEWEYMNRALLSCRGNVSDACRLLGIPRQTFYRKLRRYPPSR
jgi:two-component system response regulator RegA